MYSRNIYPLPPTYMSHFKEIQVSQLEELKESLESTFEEVGMQFDPAFLERVITSQFTSISSK